MEEKQGGAVDLRGFAAGTASGITKLVVGKVEPPLLIPNTGDSGYSLRDSDRRTPVRRDQSPVTMHAPGDLRRSVGLPQADRPV